MNQEYWKAGTEEEFFLLSCVPDLTLPFAVVRIPFR